MPATNLPDEQIWQLAAFVKALSAPAIESKPPGDAAVGETIFWGKADCGSCHRVLGRGGMLGPDLSNIGALRPVDQIRESILDPDADGFRGYQGVTAITKEGRTISGVARSRTNYSIVVLDKSGNLHTLRTGDLRDLKFSQHSPMPSYKQRINAQELTDLIAYLSRLSVRPYTDTTGKEPAGMMTYCLPSTIYVTGFAIIPPPVSKSQSSSPLRESSAKKFVPLLPKTRPPAVDISPE